MIIQDKLSEGIKTIYKQKEEDKTWQLYLSIPVKEKSYLDWKAEVLQTQNEKENIEEDIEVAKNKAKNILKNFKP